MIKKTSSDEISTFLTDASNFKGGSAEGVAFPESEKEIVEFLREANASGTPVSVAGAGTGLTGGRVPTGGWVLALERLASVDRIEKNGVGGGLAVIGPGVVLKDFQKLTSQEGLLYPPDPTETNAFVGGTVATNASGARTFKYGATRKYVQRLRMILANGDLAEVKRGQATASADGKLRIPVRKPNGKEGRLELAVPQYKMPEVKHTAGYFAQSCMDAVDLLVGSEGTLGVISEMELSLLLKPQQVFSFIAFFVTEEKAWQFVAGARDLSLHNAAARNDARIQACALEYLDAASLDLVRDKFPNLPKDARAAIYVEQECQAQTETLLMEEWYTLLEQYDALVEESWFAQDAKGQNEFRELRHEVPVRVNEFIAKYGQSKIGTDMAVPHEYFEELMLYQRKRLQELSLPNLTFGHIGDSHVHLNILPKNTEEHERGWNLYRELVQKAVDLGGTVSGEHGIGKLKRPYLELLFGGQGLREMAAVKKAFDPRGILSRGNLFDERLLG